MKDLECPHCGHEWDDDSGEIAREASTCYKLEDECPNCAGAITVTVEWDPVFYVDVRLPPEPEPDDEQLLIDGGWVASDLGWTHPSTTWPPLKTEDAAAYARQWKAAAQLDSDAPEIRPM